MMASADDISTDEREKEIQELENVLRKESLRIVHAGEKKLSKKYTETDKDLKQVKADYEQTVGHPYTAPECKPSQFDSTLFVKPRSRTASSESIKDEDKASATASSQNHAI